VDEGKAERSSEERQFLDFGQNCGKLEVPAVGRMNSLSFDPTYVDFDPYTGGR